jgi:hypothetical protein
MVWASCSSTLIWRTRFDQFGSQWAIIIAGGPMPKSFQFSLAPEKLWQAINPWSFYNQGAQLGFVNINLGQTPHPEIEQKLLDEVGSYGLQLGRIGDALEVLIDHVKVDGLNRDEADALAILKGQLAEVRRVKRREHGSASNET